MEESYLCQRCRSVDWDAVFAPIPFKARWDTRTVLEFRSTLEIRPDSRCRLCLAIAFLFGLEDVEPTDELDKRFSLEAASLSYVYVKFHINVLIRRPYSIPVEQSNESVWLIGGETQYFQDGTRTTRLAKPRAIVENRVLGRDETGFEFGLPRRTVDFDRLRRWLSDCRSLGPYARPLDLPGMRAIDCELREIVPLPAAHAGYATLSYVWGQSEVPCSTDGKLPGRLPLTIEYSITVCKELGVRYLWVDRYCIQESHKHTLIRSMHRIYHESQFTIVAAAGCGPDYGLPGVGNTPRSAITVVDHPIHVGSRQLSCINDLISYPGKSAQQTGDSIWAKRGWTLQEGMLSKRLYIFLDDQVHFENDAEAHSERISPCKHTRLGPRLICSRNDDYWQTVSAFCSRDLSYPEDALDAMSGILSIWSQNMRSFRHIGGLAVIFVSSLSWLSVESSLSEALIWGISQPVPRRRGFPSWTWTGWLKPEVHVQHRSDKWIQNCLRLASVETHDGNTIHHTQLPDLLAVQHEVLDSIKILHITAQVIDICIGPPESMQFADTHLYGNQRPKSEWQVMIASNGRKTVYECEVTRLATKDEMYLSTSLQYIQCKGLATSLHRVVLNGKLRVLYNIFVIVWDEEGGFYERFGFLCIPLNPSVRTKIETIRLG